MRSIDASPETWAEVELELRKLSKVDFPGIFHFKNIKTNYKPTQQKYEKKHLEILDVRQKS